MARKSTRSGKQKQSSGRSKPPTMAEKADRHVLYQQTVQCAESEIDFVADTFHKLRGRKARLLREDFCGTAITSTEWVGRHNKNRAISIDIDEAVLEWGRVHNLGNLTEKTRDRIELIHGDVMKTRTQPVDVVLAMNFSYWCFKDRRTLKRYFRRAHNALVDDGLFFLDAYGGFDAFRELEEPREEDCFTYIWDQDRYDPVTGDTVCHIHFEFPDGSRLDKAFTYHWRLWTLPELQELLTEAGFSNVTVYWDMAEDEDENDYQPAEHGEADEGWVCYIVAAR